MLAQLLLVVAVVTELGTTQVILRFPMPDVVSCENYLELVRRQPPIIIQGAKPVGAWCLDKPTDAGKPI